MTNSVSRGAIELAFEDQPNPRWDAAALGSRLTVHPAPLLDPSTKVLTIGSCFAGSIRRALQRRGYDVYPKYTEMEIDPDRQKAGSWGRINHYDTFTIRQEFERVLLAEPGPYPHVAVKSGWKPKRRAWTPAFVDPYRKDVMAADAEAMDDVVDKLDECLAAAVEAADVYVITLGLIETWVDTTTGRHVWSVNVPKISGDRERFQFHLSTYQENYDNVRWIVQSLLERYPDKRIVLTVSPVGLKETFTERDIVVANTYSKAVLRSVAGAIDDEFAEVTYWPSYEIALQMDLWQEDRRHVTVEGVEFIVDAFLAAHASPSAEGDAPDARQVAIPTDDDRANDLEQTK